MPITTVPLVDTLPAEPSISDPTNFEAEADGFLGGMPDFRTSLNGSITAFNTATGEFTTAANNAVSDLDAAIAAAQADFDAQAATAGFTGTSTSSVAIGTGSKSFTIQTGRSFVAGAFITAYFDATNYMWGTVTSYNAGTGALVMSSAAAVGSGTKTAWTISLAGPQGPLATVASAANYWGSTNNTEFLSAKTVADAQAPVALSVTGTVTLDMSTGLNWQLTLTGNITLADPANKVNGKSGVIWFIQDGTGSRTLTTNAAIKRVGGRALTLSTAASTVDRCSYVTRASAVELTELERGIA